MCEADGDEFHQSVRAAVQGMTDLQQTLWLSPRGHLLLEPWDEAPAMDPGLLDVLAPAFARGSGHGLLRLGAGEAGRVLAPGFAYWRAFGVRFITAVCTRPEGAGPLPGPPPDWDLELAAAGAPPMPGAEYLTAEVLLALWEDLGRAFAAELAEAGVPVQDFLRALNPVWNVMGRVHFNLAENRKDEAAPFAFLASYTGTLSDQGKARHLPLGQALKEYAGEANQQRLLGLLLPIQRAAQACPWLRRMVDAGEIFHPLRWSPGEAFQLLQDIPALEAAGVVVRMPAGWKAGRPARPRVSGTVGAAKPSGFGVDALLDFRMEVTLDDEPLTPEEVRVLLVSAQGLALIRGRWIEVDRDRFQGMMDRFREAERLAARGGLSFQEAMRMLAGADIGAAGAEEAGIADWSKVSAGPWLASTLKGLRSPEGLAALDPGPALRGTLRPYQQSGVRWLHLLSTLGLGACLADDMGLGKTIQVLALLLVQAREGGREGPGRPSLLVAPASLLANWVAELERFAPSLTFFVAHPSAQPASALKSAPDLAGLDLLITTYGFVLRCPWLGGLRFRQVILDEAQAIKNPAAKQTRQVKLLKADARIALTGTPVENRLGDLWSIFDFLNPGLLGSAKSFTAFTRGLAERSGSFGPLRDLVRPYILRRVKTDKSVLSDLPDKTELKSYCPLSRSQAALYQEAVGEMTEQLAAADGIQRRGLVLSFLMRFKQICNHPSQWLGDGGWQGEASGKFGRLRELCETIAQRQEKLLVFTQFRETTGPLAAFLGGIFGRAGLVLHGGTVVKQRQELVRRFQEDETVPFFVLSLKAGGSGLNLTAASHVIHFDRWWNPSVENQATDRAFRIGQKRNVMVHKFICRGTVEEKIDALIESKRELSQELLEGGRELNLTELGDDELLRLVALDLNAALEE
jgi:non-specific serine/threonine protein kinase